MLRIEYDKKANLWAVMMGDKCLYYNESLHSCYAWVADSDRFETLKEEA